MSEYTPISTKAELELINDDECVDGYRAGLNGEPEPGSDKSKSYWHGWRNGMMDMRRIPDDWASRNLCAEIVRSWKAH